MFSQATGKSTFQLFWAKVLEFWNCQVSSSVSNVSFFVDINCFHFVDWAFLVLAYVPCIFFF